MNTIFSNRTFDVLKWISIVCLPALATFVAVISKIWNFPDLGIMISETITAIGLLLGALLGVSAIQYKNGGKS